MRSFPNAVKEFMRFQVGEVVTRRGKIALKFGCGFKFKTGNVEIFRLVGYGSTEAAAWNMAKISPPARNAEKQNNVTDNVLIINPKPASLCERGAREGEVIL